MGRDDPVGELRLRLQGQKSVSIKTSTSVISPIYVSQRFFRFGKWPERTWQAKTSMITRVEMRLVISAAS